MSDSQDFEAQQVELQINAQEQIRPFSVRKYLQNPKQLMEKILFNSFKIDPFFPVQFLPIPEMMNPNTAQKDTNNMSLIQQSAFRHQKLKKDVFGFLLNNHLPTKTNIKNIPTMKEFYQDKHPFFQKYASNPKSKFMATFLLDSKSILKQDIKKNNQDIFVHDNSPNTLATHRSRIQFSSNFQCGNLFRVYQIHYNQFDLILQNDINTKGNNQWFFFMIRNVPKGVTLKLNIVNFHKKHSLFDLGMKPYVFSMIRYQKRKVGWVRQGSKVSYEQNDKFCHQNWQKPYYKLSFEYKFNYQGDILYFSQSLPYRVSDLTKFIFDHVKNPNNARILKLRDLNRTLGNQDLNIMEITDQNSRQDKKVVWVIARQHAGQVTSSFMVQGIVNFLLNQSPITKQLLKKYLFKIVPMINIDGVIHGNSRADLSGSDPNRKWQNPHKLRNPIIWALKKYIERDKGKVQMFLDLHSHSRKIGTFFYGNSFIDNKLSTRKYPWMVCKNDERFTYSECRFSQINNASARHVLFQSLKIPLIYTVQSSLYGYQKNDHRIIQYLPNDYRQMGQTLIQTFWEHLLSGSSSIKNILNKKEQKHMIKQIFENQQNDLQSVGSDSDPGEDQYQQKQLKLLLPNFYGIKKTKKMKVVKKPKNNQKLKKVEKQEPQTPVLKTKKNDKQSHYRIYFSGRVSALQKRGINQRLSVQTKEAGIQASIPDASILKGSINISPTVLIQKRSSLCIWGQKVQEQVSVFGNTIGLQVDMMRMFQNKDEGRKSLPSRKNFKVTNRINSILQVKQNNFLNRGDCHTLPMRSLSKR